MTCHTEKADFAELLKYTAAGFAGGLLLGTVLDWRGLQRSAVGQWLVRTLSGEGESICEGIFALRRRLGGGAGSMAEAYGWGKLLGLALPWLIDAGSRFLEVPVYGIEGFYIPYFYAMSDQIGGNLSGLFFLRRQAPSWSSALRQYVRHPVMLTGSVVIFLVPMGLLLARSAGFSPATQTLTACETMASNLCWLPPLVGFLAARRSL